MKRTQVHHHEHRHHTTINEHRAPTDESVALLQEMERKAEDKVLSTIPIKNNVVEGIIVQKQLSPLSPELKTYVCFKLNGHRFDVIVGEQDLLTHDPQAALQVFAEALAQQLTLKIVQELMK
jgi:hypothetical protein